LFWIETNAQYHAFCIATERSLPTFWGIERFKSSLDYPDHPVIGVGHGAALAYAQWCGKRLPTEAEWEYAARGGLEGKKYDRGDEFKAEEYNTSKSESKSPVAVGNYLPNRYGVYDMVGNVREWVADYYAEDYYANSPEKNPKGHAFFTMSLGMGCILTYGSYMRKTDSIPKAAVQITLLDTLVAILACVVMFSIIFSNPDMQISKSAGILFTTLPTVFIKMPGGNFIMTMFYCLVAFAALTSTISLLEVISSYSIDELKWSRKKAALTVAFSVFVFGSLNALSLGANSQLSNFNLFGKETTVGMFGLVAASWWTIDCSVYWLGFVCQGKPRRAGRRTWRTLRISCLAVPDQVCSTNCCWCYCSLCNSGC